MGIIDLFKGKKDKDDDLIIEKSDSGYVLKGQKSTASPRVKRVHILVSSAKPLADERELVMGLIKEFGLAPEIAPEAPISIKYEIIPDIDEYIAKGEMPESLNSFLMARALLEGLARGPAEMAKLAVDPFDHKGHKGVLVCKEA
jgi:hypothetical protein